MALSAAKKVPRMGTSAGGDAFLMTVTSGATIYAGAAVVMIDGYNTVSPATAAANLRSAGIAQSAPFVDPASGLTKVWCEQGVFKLKNNGSNTLTGAHEGSNCYFEDDETVSSNSSSRSVAGKVVRVDSSSVVWVQLNKIQ